MTYGIGKRTRNPFSIKLEIVDHFSLESGHAFDLSSPQGWALMLANIQ